MKDFDLIFEIIEKIISHQPSPHPLSLPLPPPSCVILPVQPPPLNPSASHSPPSLSIIPKNSAPSFIIEILGCLDALAKRFVSQALAKKIIVNYFGIVRGVVEKIEEVKNEKGIQYFLNFICFLTIDCEDEEIEVKSN